jgi:hypothetical protein
MDDDELQVPKPGIGDYTITAVKTGVQFVPLIGGPLAELIGAIGGPLERRRDAFLEALVREVRRLSGELEGVTAASFYQSDAFISAVMTALPAALRTSEEEKLQALRNAVLNAAIRFDVDEEVRLWFVRLTDDLSLPHLLVLRALDERPVFPDSWDLTNRLISPRDWVLLNYPQLADPPWVFWGIVEDLRARGLVPREARGLATTPHPNTEFNPLTSQLGRRYLEFVRSPGTQDPGY